MTEKLTYSMCSRPGEASLDLIGKTSFHLDVYFNHLEKKNYEKLLKDICERYNESIM